MKPTAKTHNNANAYEHSEDAYLEFFSKAGSMFKNRQKYYMEPDKTALDLFKDAWRAGDKVLSMQMLMWLRSVRDGAGNRSAFREILTWLGTQYPEWVTANIGMIPEIGRWDDLKALYGTPCEEAALDCWCRGLDNPDTSALAAKWADRQDSVLRKFMRETPRNFRKMLVAKTNVVETQMCSGKWEEINYNQVPSVASTRYGNAFRKHDEGRYNNWRISLAKPEGGTKVNTGAIFPHDIIRAILNANVVDNDLDALCTRQLQDMNNYIPENQRIMPICDFSGSMETPVAGSVTALDISLALGLYCSEKVGKDNPFYRKLIPFSNHAVLESWQEYRLIDAVRKIPDGYVGTTNIHSAFNVLLESAKFFNIPKNMMPTTLLILSDMAFDQGVSDETPVEECLLKWEEMGYDRPSVVFWNMNPMDSQPATCKDKNVCMVSGFSPSILKAVLSGEDLSPMAVLRQSVSHYHIIQPSA